MRGANQVDGLYPVIRRIRRPLLPVDPPGESKVVETSGRDESKPASGAASELGEEKKPDAEDSSQ